MTVAYLKYDVTAASALLLVLSAPSWSAVVPATSSTAVLVHCPARRLRDKSGFGHMKKGRVGGFDPAKAGSSIGYSGHVPLQSTRQALGLAGFMQTPKRA